MGIFKFVTKKEINNLPKSSGVYCFKNRKKIIYIGKATKIKNRVKNHFNRPSYRDNLFINKVDEIGFLETDSEIEALVLEANLIKKYQPKYNVIWKDDKNYFYVAIAKNNQKIPYIFITHQKNNSNVKHLGPFVEGVALKKTLRFLRKAFPYYTSPKHPKIKCLYCHLDLCPGPKPNLVEYKKNIKKLILILRGRKSAVLNSLKKEMKKFSKENKFEEAAKVRDKIYVLQQVMKHAHIIESWIAGFLPQQKASPILGKIIGLKNSIHKIECYDISNIQGKSATGSMVVFINENPEKSQYKKFKIKTENKPNDIAMLKEVLQRRFLHAEWRLPEVILIDGGRAQLNVAIKIKNQKTQNKNIKIISFAKGKQELFIEGRPKPIQLKSLPKGVYNLVKQLDAEAHRFAINYHKKLRNKKILN